MEERQIGGKTEGRKDRGENRQRGGKTEVREDRQRGE